MNDEDRLDQYELFVLGASEPDVAEEIRASLNAGDRATQLAVNRAQDLMMVLATSIPQLEPPARLRKRIMGAIREEQTGWGGWSWAWAALSALLAFVAINSWQREQTKAAELVAVRQELGQAGDRLATVSQLVDFLNEPQLRIANFGKPDPQPPRGRVLVSPQRGVLLLVSNLPAAAQGRIYEMWLVPKSGTPIPAGLFQTDPSGKALHINARTIDLTQVAAIAVSNEPEAGSTAPTTTPFIIAPLAE